MHIGLLGGTFDPPHYGHMIMAEEALTQCSLDEVWFLPSFIPPHKDRSVTESEDRLKMVELAVSDNPRFTVTKEELDREGKSYTFETVRAFKEKYPEHHFYFILGGDMVVDLPNWHNYAYLADAIEFIGVGRPGTEMAVPEGVKMNVIEMPGIDISSTLIREKAENHANIRYYIPEKVRRYIEENNIYGS